MYILKSVSYSHRPYWMAQYSLVCSLVIVLGFSCLSSCNNVSKKHQVLTVLLYNVTQHFNTHQPVLTYILCRCMQLCCVQALSVNTTFGIKSFKENLGDLKLLCILKWCCSLAGKIISNIELLSASSVLRSLTSASP